MKKPVDWQFKNRFLNALGMALVYLLLSTAAPNIIHVAQASEIIKEVQYFGLHSVTVRELETALPFQPGDAWKKDLPKTIVVALTEYYEKRGFYNAKINVQTAETKGSNILIRIRVDEGKPCIIKSVWIDDPPGFKSKHVMLRFKTREYEILKVKAGDRYDEVVLLDRTRELRDWLVGENFILANTDNVRLTYNDSKTEVELVVVVDYGDRVSFGFQGNTVFTKGELDDFILQVQTTGLGKDYIGLIQRKFEDEYRARAYNDIKITTKVTEGPSIRRVTFFMDEGPRTELLEFKMEGLSSQNLDHEKDVFHDSVSRLVQRGYYVEKDIDKGIQVVLEDLRANGYLFSKSVAKSVQTVKSKKGTHRVKVSVQLAEGEQTLIGKIELKKFSFTDSKKVLEILGLKEGAPFNPYGLEEGIQKLKSYYINEGFLDFKILTKDDDVVNFVENQRIVNVHLEASEGPRLKVGDISIHGLQRTKPYVVKRELAITTDDWWLGTKLDETETNIKELGLFSDVKLRPVPSDKGEDYRDLVIDVREVEPGVLEGGPGFRSDLGLKLFGGVSYNNLFGRNWIGSITAEANKRVNSDYRFIEYKFDAALTEPRFFGTRFLYTIGVSTKKERFPPDFNAVTTTFVTGFERRFRNVLNFNNNVSIKLHYKLERIRQFDVFFQNQIFADDNRSMLIGSIDPSITFDTRDNPFVTTSGWMGSLSLEYAHPYLSGSAITDANAPGYQKWTASIHRYTPITKDIVWSKVISAGFARSNIAAREIPLIKLFRLGGYSTIRGFAEDSINVDSERIFGTLTFLNLRTQVDLPLVGDLKFAPFIDAGNLFTDKDHYHQSPFLRAGAGVGLHYMTPIGPINLDWGYKLNPGGDDAPSLIHFSVGFI